MGRNQERDAAVRIKRRQQLLSSALKILSSRGIDTVSMNEIAKACKVGVATLYRHYPTKADLIVDVAGWTWENEIHKHIGKAERKSGNAFEMLDSFLDALLDLCKKKQNALRFLQFFQVYSRTEHLQMKEMDLRAATIEQIGEWFHQIYTEAGIDGTLRTEMPEKKAFSLIMNTILTTGTRICAGLCCVDGIDPEEELQSMKMMIIRSAKG